MNKKVANYLNAPFMNGVVILDISKSSPADISGLERGDIILTFNGVDVNEPRDIRRLIYENDIRAGDVVKLKIFRNGKYKKTKMKLTKFE